MIIDLELDDFMNKVHSVRTRGFIYTRNKKNYVVVFAHEMNFQTIQFSFVKP